MCGKRAGDRRRVLRSQFCRALFGADPDIRHIGPVAEDFNAHFPFGIGPTTIGLGDFDGVNLAAIQALDRRTLGMQEQLARLRDENAALRDELDRERRARDELTARLERLETLVSRDGP